MQIPKTPDAIWWQACYYKSGSNSPWQAGIARMRHSPDCHDVVFILDAEGNKAKQVHDYELVSANHERATAIRIQP